MSRVREVVESLIRLVKSGVHPGAVLVAPDDVFEVTATPSVVLQGPTLSEDLARRTPATQVVRNQDDLTFEARRHPRLYHLDFDVTVTTGKESELLELIEGMSRFYQTNPTLDVAGHGCLGITELVPLGGLKRVNLSNLRQASGRCRVEDCPIFDARTTSGRLTTGVQIDLHL